MRWKQFSIFAYVMAGILCAAVARANEDAPWETAKDDGYAIAMPKGWTTLDKFSPQVLLFRRSDGQGGVPAKDENGAELQAQIIVEKVKMAPGLEDSANVVASRVLQQPQTEVIQRAVGDHVKLSDDTDAFLMSMEITRGSEHMLIIKLLCKIDDGNGFVVTGTLTAGKPSTIPTIDSKTGKWLKTMVASFVRDPSKIDGKKVDEAFKERDKK